MAETIAVVLTAAGVAAKTASTIGTVVSTVATVASVGSAIATPIIAGKRQEKQEKANAERLRADANRREVAASVQAERERRRSRQMIANQEASLTEAGVASGTSLDLVDQNSVALELDALTVEFAGEQQADSLRDSAAQREFVGSLAGSSGVLSGLGGGVASLATSFNRFDPLNFEESASLSGRPV